MDTQTQLHENISALADGELAAGEIELAFAALGTPDGLAAWQAYHQIGHALRSDRCGAELSMDFSLNLAARLKAEAPILQHSGGRMPGVRDAGSNSDTVAPAASLP